MCGRLAVILAVSSLALLAPTRAMAAPTPVTIPEGVSPPLDTKGQGLCIASAVSMQPTLDFGFLNAGNYNGNLNTYMEAHAKDRVESVQHTVTDLSNNVVIGNQTISYGDF